MLSVTLCLVKVIGSNVGLCLVLVLYTLAGGYAFIALEQTNEKEECTNAEDMYIPMENTTANNLWAISEAYP